MKNPEAIGWAMACDGSFSIQKVRDSLQPKISLNNTRLDLIEEFHEMVGYGYTGVHVWNAKKNWKSIHHWYIQSHSDCLAFCEEIVDFLPIKQRRALLLIEFCDRGVERIKNNESVGPRDWEIYEEMKRLNKRGKR